MSAEKSSIAETMVKPREAIYHLGQVAEADVAQAAGDARQSGIKLFETGKYQLAIPLLERAMAADPADSRVLICLGRSLYAASRWLAAEPVLEKAVKLAPSSYEARFHYAESLLRNGRFARAEEEFQKAISLIPLWRRMKLAIRKRVQTAKKIRPDQNPYTDDPWEKLNFARRRREGIEWARSGVAEGKANAAWRRAERGRKFNVGNTPLIGPKTKIFTIGSCFALEIRHELLRRGLDVYPKYTEIDFDPNSQIVNSLPERDNINHYDTFTIRQEFEQAFGGKHFQLGHFWPLKGTSINKALGRETVWQDPHRKNIYAADEKGILHVSSEIDRAIHEGILAADVYVITLGLIEAWLNPQTGLYACCFPGVGGGGGDQEQSQLHLGTFQENYENMRRVCELIFNRFPEKHIILTVSPVALERTFTDQDVVFANMESKCQLRAVAGQLCRDFPNVHYLPSFELFIYHDLHHDNGRHAARDAVDVVVDMFAKCFVVPEKESI